MTLMLSRLLVLVAGCPVCRQRTRHLVFCRWRPVPSDRETATPLLLGGVVSFWIATYLVAGWIGVVAFGTVGVLAFGGLSLLKGPAEAGPYRAEEIVGELYPQPKLRAPNKPESKGPPLRSRRRRTTA